MPKDSQVLMLLLFSSSLEMSGLGLGLGLGLGIGFGRGSYGDLQVMSSSDMAEKKVLFHISQPISLLLNEREVQTRLGYLDMRLKMKVKLEN